MNEELRAQLAEFDEAWEEAPEGSVYDNLPDGKYQANIEEVRFENAKTSGRLQLAWVLEVLSPRDYLGRKIFHYRGLDNSDTVGWMKKEIFACGLKVDKISELPDMLPNLLDRVIEVTLKTKKSDKGEFQNCFINKLLDAPDIDGEIAEEDTPF